MNKSEMNYLTEKVVKVINEDGYIKGYGVNCRLMDNLHNPVINFPKIITTNLFDNGFLKLEGYIYKLNEDFV